jgi:hypothetical protein
MINGPMERKAQNTSTTAEKRGRKPFLLPF